MRIIHRLPKSVSGEFIAKRVSDQVLVLPMSVAKYRMTCWFLPEVEIRDGIELKWLRSATFYNTPRCFATYYSRNFIIFYGEPSST